MDIDLSDYFCCQKLVSVGFTHWEKCYNVGLYQYTWSVLTISIQVTFKGGGGGGGW